ncbi:OmpA/MotB family protein [Jatrophihabitans fulvus]
MPAAHGAAAGSARVRRKRAHGEHGGEEGSERWLVTYADMLTLLLVLFIVLFSISVVNTSKFISLKTSLAAVFGDGSPGPLKGGSGLLDNSAEGSGQQMVMPGMPVAPSVGAQASGGKTDPDLQAIARKADAAREKENFEKTQSSLRKALTKAGLEKAVRFTIDRRGLVITVVTNALVFAPNSANLRPDARKILRIVAPELAKQPRSIEVDGHTNQQKASTFPYPSGWELSTARASAVVRYLAEDGVSQDRLTAVGYADTRPLYPATDPRSVTLNRRVEIVVLSTHANDPTGRTSVDPAPAQGDTP